MDSLDAVTGLIANVTAPARVWSYYCYYYYCYYLLLLLSLSLCWQNLFAMAAADESKSPAAGRPAGYKETLSRTGWTLSATPACPSPAAGRAVCRTDESLGDISRVSEGSRCKKWPLRTIRFSEICCGGFWHRGRNILEYILEAMLGSCPAVWIVRVRINSSSRYVGKRSYLLLPLGSERIRADSGSVRNSCCHFFFFFFCGGVGILVSAF